MEYPETDRGHRGQHFLSPEDMALLSAAFDTDTPASPMQVLGEATLRLRWHPQDRSYSNGAASSEHIGTATSANTTESAMGRATA